MESDISKKKNKILSMVISAAIPLSSAFECLVYFMSPRFHIYFLLLEMANKSTIIFADLPKLSHSVRHDEFQIRDVIKSHNLG